MQTRHLQYVYNTKTVLFYIFANMYDLTIILNYLHWHLCDRYINKFIICNDKIQIENIQ